MVIAVRLVERALVRDHGVMVGGSQRLKIFLRLMSDRGGKCPFPFRHDQLLHNHGPWAKEVGYQDPATAERQRLHAAGMFPYWTQYGSRCYRYEQSFIAGQP